MPFIDQQIIPLIALNGEINAAASQVMIDARESISSLKMQLAPSTFDSGACKLLHRGKILTNECISVQQAGMKAYDQVRLRYDGCHSLSGGMKKSNTVDHDDAFLRAGDDPIIVAQPLKSSKSQLL